MKPLISYYGGKQRIAPQIVEVIETIQHSVYAEPFAGGLAVLFAKPKKTKTNQDHYREAINDHDELLINLYRVAREQPKELERLIQFTPYSQSEYLKALKICKHPQNFSAIDQAWAYYVNIQQSFSNRLNAGWSSKVSSENGAATWANKTSRLLQSLERLSGVHIGCEDALKFIKRWDAPQTLFYCDPPYPESHQGHYDGYTIEDWKNLCKALDNCQASYVLSNYRQTIEPKSAQRKIEIKAIMSATKSTGDRTEKQVRANTKRIEVLWICDRSAAMRGDLKHAANAQKYEQVTLFDV